MEDKFTFDEDLKTDKTVITAEDLDDDEYLKRWKEFPIDRSVSSAPLDEDWRDPLLATEEDYGTRKLFSHSSIKTSSKDQLQTMFQDSSKTSTVVEKVKK